jgi:hypothetical protein
MRIMKTQLLVISISALCLCSCSRSSAPDKQPNADAKPAATESEAIAKDEKAGTFWELPDKSELRVVTAPWPPKEGPATLKAEVTANDDGGMFTGTVACRVTTTEQSSAVWQPMPKVREGNDKSVYFESAVALNQGNVYIQFRVHGAGESAYNKDHFDLTDWKIEVK